jgi:hypothetical protein
LTNLMLWPTKYGEMDAKVVFDVWQPTFSLNKIMHLSGKLRLCNVAKMRSKEVRTSATRGC